MNKMYQRLKESTLTPEEATARRIEMIKAGYNPYNQEDIIKFDELKASGAKIETQQERWKRQDQESQTALKDTAEKARQDFYSSEQGKENEEVIKRSREAVLKSLEDNARILKQFSDYRERSRQEEQRLAAQREETRTFKTILAAKTKEAINSGAVVEWDSILQAAKQDAESVRQLKSNAPAIAAGAAGAGAGAVSGAAAGAAGAKTTTTPTQTNSDIRDAFSDPFGSRRRRVPQTNSDIPDAFGSRYVPQMEEIKLNTKESIINNFMENAKPEFARRGVEKQRPKSWSKGTKSGSDKRKMREQGKREAREMNESKAGQNIFRPEPGGVGSAMDKSLADAINVFSGEGVSIPKTITPRVAQILRDELAWRQNMDKIINRGVSTVGSMAPGGMHAEPVNEGMYYTKLKEAAQSWGPEMAGASQDDATAQAYAEGQPEDPYHRVSADEREEMARTLASDYGTEKIRAGLLGKIATLAGSAHKTSSKQDDLAAMERIQHLIGYGNAIIDAKHKPLPSDQGMPF